MVVRPSRLSCVLVTELTAVRQTRTFDDERNGPPDGGIDVTGSPEPPALRPTALGIDEQLAADDGGSMAGPVTGTSDSTQVEWTFNSAGNDVRTVNCSRGGFGQSTGTAWFDDLSLVPSDGGSQSRSRRFQISPEDVSDGWWHGFDSRFRIELYPVTL